ncbi:Nif3-like dinuclear metal center hexameric protein, partial [Staphylococcus epidermidis]
PFVIKKSSNLPGKEIIETPGLVYGDRNREVKKIAVTMTMTEGSIELAGATGVDAIVAHHPIAEAANSGGVTLKNYLDLYNISAFELHEAFHGLHPGIPFLHGHEVY